MSEARPVANSRTDRSFKWPNRRCQTCSGRGAVDEVDFDELSWTAADARFDAALRAKVDLSITLQCSLYIPPIFLQDAMAVPALSIIWHTPPPKVIL